ncbi:BQ5605_C019g08967 [Microbotryum silenes-dioicae]|uniref:BQ5605_C019g08967 protein n=1 Tax=Microbotryum silenes-dioicae TaxID=796604 RepID=A0A2X0LW60_9BASI|nr:BQ5605_C019g08967 [Microbotryum silenes-dioicae]
MLAAPPSMSPSQPVDAHTFPSTMRPQAPLKRAHTTTTPTEQTTTTPSPPTKRPKLATSSSATANPLELKPLGNLIFRPSAHLTRTQGLGILSILPDELLLSHIFSALDGEDLVRAQGVSKAFFGWTRVEGIWKGLYIERTRGRLHRWRGSWRASYVRTFLLPPSESSDGDEPLPTSLITTPSHHSDVLFQPCLCAAFDPCRFFRSNNFVSNIPRISGKNLLPSDLPQEPCILTDLMTTWSAIDPTSTHQWTLPRLASRFPNTLFRAEATLTTLPSYETYHDRCELDESPLYLFDSEYVNKTQSLDAEGKNLGLGGDYEVPLCFGEDLFGVMEGERPDYRWLIVGPTRSGSVSGSRAQGSDSLRLTFSCLFPKTWHQDPNGTSAWNAITTGSKAWIMFPPSLTPPGVHVSEDQGQVEAPLALSEWFMSYWDYAVGTYGPQGKDAALRDRMKVGICREGEVFYVPSGWWHIVVNLEPSIAVTQNYVSQRELASVLRFMRDRPDQVSGFKRPRTEQDQTRELVQKEDCDELVSDVFELFVQGLKKEHGEMVEKALEEIGGMKKAVSSVSGRKEGNGVHDEKSRTKGMWEKVKEDQGDEGGFSFGFGGEEFEKEDEEGGSRS